MNKSPRAKPHKYLVLGSNGRLGLQLASRLETSEALDLTASSIRSMVTRCDFRVLQEIQKSFDLTIFNAIGLTNSKSDQNALNRVNVMFPYELGEFLLDTGSKMFTFGSILENESLLASTNNYLGSKREFLHKFLGRKEFLTQFSHVQLHTLFGSKDAHAHMFLGQIIESITQNTKFRMTSGRQIRQYHHIADVADSIINIEKLDLKGLIQLNGQVGLQLIEIAHTIFSHFNSMHLLEIDKSYVPKHEIFTNMYEFDSRLWIRTPKEGLGTILNYVISHIQSNPTAQHHLASSNALQQFHTHHHLQTDQ
jgi:nucleoside-diphosphate-sugar epimerase